MDSWQYKEGEDTDLKRPWNEEKIYNVNSEISRFRGNNTFTHLASTLCSCEQNFAKFPWRAQWK